MHQANKAHDLQARATKAPLHRNKLIINVEFSGNPGVAQAATAGAHHKG